MSSLKAKVFGLYARSFCSDAAWTLFGSGLRILTYHGVCDDSVEHEPWVPSYFVGRSTFEEHLRYLTKKTCLLKLTEAAALLKAGRLPKRATCVTFDDGYANNLHVALPLLQKYSVPATIFLSTSYVVSGELLPFDRVRLVRFFTTGDPSDGDYYKYPIDELDQRYAEAWKSLRPQLKKEIWETLRPLTMEELSAFPADLIEIGAHTRSHCILPNETAERRTKEINTSLQEVSEWTGNEAPLFSYPNGIFEPCDKETVARRTTAAVTTVAGRNDKTSDLLELSRYTITLGYDLSTFIAELTGLRTVVLRLNQMFGRI